MFDSGSVSASVCVCAMELNVAFKTQACLAFGRKERAEVRGALDALRLQVGLAGYRDVPAGRRQVGDAQAIEDLPQTINDLSRSFVRLEAIPGLARAVFTQCSVTSHETSVQKRAFELAKSKTFGRWARHASKESLAGLAGLSRCINTAVKLQSCPETFVDLVTKLEPLFSAFSGIIS